MDKIISNTGIIRKIHVIFESLDPTRPTIRIYLEKYWSSHLNILVKHQSFMYTLLKSLRQGPHKVMINSLRWSTVCFICALQMFPDTVKALPSSSSLHFNLHFNKLIEDGVQQMSCREEKAGYIYSSVHTFSSQFYAVEYRTFAPTITAAVC